MPSSTGQRTCLCGERVYRTLQGQTVEPDSYRVHKCAQPDELPRDLECARCGAIILVTPSGLRLDPPASPGGRPTLPHACTEKPDLRSTLQVRAEYGIPTVSRLEEEAGGYEL